MDIYDRMKPAMRNNEVVWRHIQRGTAMDEYLCG